MSLRTSSQALRDVGATALRDVGATVVSSVEDALCMTEPDPTAAPEDDVVLRDATAADTAVLDTFNTYEVRTKHDYYDPDDLADGHRGASKWGSRVISDGEGRILGRVTFHQVAYGPNRRSLAWRIGVTVLPEHRMRGVGARAQRLLADELFRTTDAFRVEADTDVGNTAERRALLAAGFREEGVIRGARWRAGARRDAVMFSRLRSDV